MIMVATSSRVLVGTDRRIGRIAIRFALADFRGTMTVGM
jgi:hypothetical protein